MSDNLPIPPLEMRELVGPTEILFFDNPAGTPVFSDIPPECYETVFDFGCGCGRLARQLIQQTLRPSRYVGVDLHEGMVRWCQSNLTPVAPGFSFLHHDVHNRGFNPGGNAQTRPFPVEDGAFKLVIAWSVFTHLLEDQVKPYLEEVKRILAPGGVFLSTWFTFDKCDYPMMQSFQNALYINATDPTNAVIFDRDWLKAMLAAAGLKVARVEVPAIRGYQWLLHSVHATEGEAGVEFPPDVSATGVLRPPVPQRDASQIGMGSSDEE